MSEQWIQSKLSHIAHISSGESAVIESSGPYPIMGANGEIGRAKNYNFENGYLVGRVGAAGAVSKSLDKCWASDNALTVEPRLDHIEFSFLGCLLKHLKLERLATKTAQPLVTQTHLKSLLVEYPASFPEQKTIATILDTLDTQIRQTEAIIAKLKQVKQGLLHDLLTRGIDENGQLRPPYEQAPELYKESPLGWIPKVWNYDRLSSKSVPGMAHIKTGPFGSALKGEHWVKEGCPVITIGSLGTGEFIFSELLFISKRDELRLSDYALKKGEVVFSRVADVGRSVAINDEQEGWIMSSNLMKISLDQALVNSQFLQYQLSHPQIAKLQIRRSVNSAGRDVANSAILNQLLFFWPSKEEQDRLVKRISLLEERISNEKVSLEKLKKQKTGLMDDLLTGRVRVTELIEQEKQAS